MRINALRSACPSDANFSGDFNVNGKDSYQGTLRVLFSKGEFGATVDASNMEDLMDKLSNKIKKQIERWRETRFDQEDTFVDFKEKAK